MSRRLALGARIYGGWGRFCVRIHGFSLYCDFIVTVLIVATISIIAIFVLRLLLITRRSSSCGGRRRLLCNQVFRRAHLLRHRRSDHFCKHSVRFCRTTRDARIDKLRDLIDVLFNESFNFTFERQVEND